jgi:hypothetical protein
MPAFPPMPPTNLIVLTRQVIHWFHFLCLCVHGLSSLSSGFSDLIVSWGTGMVPADISPLLISTAAHVPATAQVQITAHLPTIAEVPAAAESPTTAEVPAAVEVPTTVEVPAAVQEDLDLNDDSEMWKMFLDEVKEEDSRITDAWKEDANSIIVFVSLILLVPVHAFASVTSSIDRSILRNCWRICH